MEPGKFKHLRVVQYPGRIINPQKAIETLGGLSGLSNVRNFANISNFIKIIPIFRPFHRKNSVCT